MQRNNIIEISKDENPVFQWTLFASIVLISSMILIRDIGIASVSPAFFVMATVLISIILPYNSLRSFSFFYIVGGVGIHGGALAAIVVALLIKSRKKNIYQFVFTLIILLFELIHLSTYSFKVDFNNYFIFGLFISFFFFLLFEDVDNNEDVYTDLRYYVIGTAVALFIIVLHSILLFGIEETLLGSTRLGTGFDEEEINDSMVTQLNSNYMAYYSIAATALILFVKNLFNKNWLKYVLLTILILAGIMSSSRTWLLLMAFVVIIHFLASRKRARLEIIVAFLLLVVFASKYANYKEALIGRFEERFEEENIATAGSRTELIALYNQYLLDHPDRLVYGTGSLYYRRVSEQNLSTHNGTQQLIVCYGFIGLLIFVWCGIVFYKRYYKKNKKAIKLVTCTPLFVCILFLQSIQFISPPSLMLPLVAALLPLKFKLINDEPYV